MTMAFNIKKLRETGDPKDEARAAMIQSILDDRGEDIPLPETQVPQNPDVLETSETLLTHSLMPVEVKLARYSLADSAYDPLDILDNDDIERRLALDEAFTAITEPYYYAAKLKTPSATETKNRGKSEITWQSENKTDNEIIYYSYTLKFLNGKEANTTQSLEVKYGLRKEPHGKDAFIRLTFDDNGVSEVSFRDADTNNWNRLPVLLQHVLAQNAGSEKARRYADGDGKIFGNPNELYTVNLRDTPLIIKCETDNHRIEKEFDQKTGMFSSKRIFKAGIFRSESPKDRVTHEDDLKAEYILEFYKDLLSIIPLEETTF